MLRVIVGGGGKKTGAQELKWEAMSADELATLASTPALFGGAQTFALQGALAGERAEEFFELAEGLVGSPHTFIFEEEKLLKKPTDILQKAGAKIEVAKAQKKEEYRFDRFGLTGALQNRDKKKLWLGLTRALRQGEKPEALAGLLAWKVRSMLSSGSAAKYQKDELAGISRQLVWMYHDSHRGYGELALLLERFALKL